jgi:predicted acyltransferase
MKHPHYGMTFANTIAPFFLISVGMGFRMSLKNRIAKCGAKNSYLAAIKRYLILIIIGIVLYGPDPVCGMYSLSITENISIKIHLSGWYFAVLLSYISFVLQLQSTCIRTK